jgi:hypothetical protein
MFQADMHFAVKTFRLGKQEHKALLGWYPFRRGWRRSLETPSHPPDETALGVLNGPRSLHVRFCGWYCLVQDKAKLDDRAKCASRCPRARLA